MSNDVLDYIDSNSPPLTWHPHTKDLGGSVHQSMVAITNVANAQVNPATSDLQTSILAALAALGSPLQTGSSVGVTGTFWQATQPVSISGAIAVTGTFFQSTQPISAATLPLPAGAATSALQTTANTSLASILSGMATAANQTTANTSLASILSAFAALSTAAKQDSALTVLNSILSAFSPIATAANQATMITSLASLVTGVNSAIPAGTNTIGGVQQVSTPSAQTARQGYLQGAASGAVAAAVGTLGGWATGDTITLHSTGSGITTSCILSVASTQIIGTPTINAAGTFTGTTGTYTILGTTGTGTKFQIQATLTNGSGLTAIVGIQNGGIYTVNPTSLTAEPVSYGGLTGATIGIKMGIGTLSVSTAGVYAPTTAAQIATMLAAATPASTSGSGSLTGVSIVPAYAGLATQVAASNGARKTLFLQNISAANMGYSFFSTTPVIGVPGTEALVPNGSLSENGPFPPSQALYAVGAAFAAYSGREV